MKIFNIIYRTNPIVAHYNGYTKSKDGVSHYFLAMQKKFFSEPSRSIGAAKKLTILTWNNGQNQSLVERCLDRLGVPYQVLGKDVTNKPWNHYYKIETLYNAIGSVGTEYILGLDAFDVMVLDDPAKIVERFEKRFKCDLLYNASVYEWPKDYHTRQFEEEVVKTRFRYLNGGCFIGRTAFIKEVIEMAARLRKEMRVDLTEQPLLRILYRRLYPRIQVDGRCEIFQTLKRVQCFAYGSMFFAASFYRDVRRPAKQYIAVPQEFLKKGTDTF